MSRHMRVAAIAVATALLTMGGIATAHATTPVPGESASNPIVVKSLTDVPDGAVQDKVSTFETDAKCDTTKSWVLPGSDAVTHSEGQYLRVIDEQDAVTHSEWNIESRGRTYTPALEEVSHQELKYQRTVDVYETQYQFAKYTQTRTRTWVEGTQACPDLWWNWSPNDSTGPQDYTPAFPSDPRGTWQGPHEGGGPMQDTYGTFQTGGGNSPFFHRDQGTPGTDGHWTAWSEYGPWTLWAPVTHVSWQDSIAPLGTPAFHAQWKDGNIEYYRQWQDRATGQTRQMQTGTTTETTDWLLGSPEGEGWKQVDQRKVITTEASPEVYGPWSDWTRINEAPYLEQPTPPADTATHEYRVVGPITVTDIEPVPEYTEYYVINAEPSRSAEDASWEAQSPGESWTLFNERVVTDTAAVAPVFYAWSDNATCAVVDDVTNPVSPVVLEAAEPPVALAHTGSDAWRPVGLGMALLLVGAALVLAGRKQGVTTA